MPANHFYVYEHWRPDLGVCFYVGKGNGPRAGKLSSRNERHKAVVSELRSAGFSVDVRIVASGLAEEEALRIERERVAFYGLATLCNITLGGGGPSGYVFTEERKARHSVAVKAAFENNTEARAKISAAHKGRPKSEATRMKMAAAAAARGKDPAYREKMSKAKKAISPETRAKMTAANHRRWAMIHANSEKYPKIFAGHKHTAETKALLSQLRSGKKTSAAEVPDGLRI